MSALGWDKSNVFTTGSVSQPTNGSEQNPSNPAHRNWVENGLFDFIRNFVTGPGVFYYRDQLVSNLRKKYFGLDVELSDLISFNEKLAQGLQEEPTQTIELFESALLRAAKHLDKSQAMDEADEEDSLDLPAKLPHLQVVLRTTTALHHLRELSAESISKLVKVSGIIVSASSLSSKATFLHLSCKSCGFTKQLPIAAGISGVQLPRSCDNPSKDANADRCPLDPFVIDHDRSRFVDQQTLKLQEAPDMVPVGELPKHVLISADRCLTNRVVPGTRATVIGIYSTFSAGGSKPGMGAATRVPYLRMIGLVSEVAGLNRGVTSFTEEEVNQLEALSRTKDLYQKFAKSIAPSIFGNEDIKKAISCLLFGGSTKHLPDGMRLRGDINVLMLGDPSTAKSQLLKFTEKVAPISVYTSGKGSSAAGLTASVVRDPGSREFYLEGGAMVLADGGVVCIDEFDKMRDEDRVAIHEAMEQQTISIAKAGITTMLNSRTSVLAAANPVHGRYDDLRTPGENIDFQTTILSRFDLIFIVRDLYDAQRDVIIAKHVMNVHLNRANNDPKNGTNDQDPDLDIDTMKRYIAFARTRCSPRLSPEAAEVLANHFVDLRKQVARIEADSDHRSAIPITIRQLEAIVRISESLAKMELSAWATDAHVNEAIRLFKASTMEAIARDEIESGGGRTELLAQMGQIEAEIRSRLPIGSQVSISTLNQSFLSQGFSSVAIERALSVLVRQEVLQFKNSRNSVYRSGL